MIYTVTLNPSVDYVMHMEHFAPGEVNRATKDDLYFGGKGINVSVVLKNLGVESIALGFIAGFTGIALQEDLRQKGIPSRFVALPHGFSRINVKLKGACETEVNAPGPEIPKEALSRLFSQLETLSKGDFLVLAGSAPPSLPRDVYRQILGRLDGRGVNAIVDASGELLAAALDCRPFLIKPNHCELEEITSRKLETEEAIVNGARSLQKRGARNVCVSMGGNGALVLTEEGALHRICAPGGIVKNSVGAGDSLIAGFLAGYMERCDFAHALKMGAAAGSATAFSEGLASRADILKVMSQF